jgi:uncharacterized protein YkwD
MGRADDRLEGEREDLASSIGARGPRRTRWRRLRLGLTAATCALAGLPACQPPRSSTTALTVPAQPGARDGVEVALAPPPPHQPVGVRAATAASALTAGLAFDLAELHPGIRHDATLRAVAEAAAWSASVEDVISEAAVRSEMASSLRSGLTPHVLTAWIRPAEASSTASASTASATAATAAMISQDELQALHAALSTALLELAAAAPIDTFAVSVRSGPAGIVAAVAALEPPRLPLRLEHQARATIVTAPWSRQAQPVAYIVTPKRSDRLTAAVEGDSLKIVVPCGARNGDLEVTGGAGVFASIVDVCNPTNPRWAAATGDIGPMATTLVEIEQRSFELLNRERRRHGRVPIVWDARAQAMARRQSQDMARYRFVSHVGSDGNTLMQRLTHVALPALRTFENVGRAGGPGEMHQGFMTSPGHRENLLELTARAGGIGAAIDPVTHDLYLTQVLYQPKPQPLKRP